MAAPDDVEAKVRADIAAHGWHVVKVMGDADAPGWAYTIGLVEQGHPEISIFGMELAPMHQTLNHLGALVGAGRRFEAGEHDGVFEGLPCAVRPVARRWYDVFFGNAAWHYRSAAFELVQCFWPDAAGRFPWDERFAAAWRARQPLLFHDSVEDALDPRLAGTLRREGALG